MVTYTPTDRGSAKQRSGTEQEAVKAADAGITCARAFGCKSFGDRQQPLVMLFPVGTADKVYYGFFSLATSVLSSQHQERVRSRVVGRCTVRKYKARGRKHCECVIQVLERV